MSQKQKVLGIGGVFFKALDLVVLAAWYGEHLGIGVELPASYGKLTERETTAVWATFPSNTEYVDATGSPFMLKYRVADRDAMLAQPRAAGTTVDEKVEQYDYGRFGWASDPEGNRFELWQSI